MVLSFPVGRSSGRVVHLQPVVWEDGFPVIGMDYDKNGVGEPMKVCKKPSIKCNVTPHARNRVTISHRIS